MRMFRSCRKLRWRRSWRYRSKAVGRKGWRQKRRKPLWWSASSSPSSGTQGPLRWTPSWEMTNFLILWFEFCVAVEFRKWCGLWKDGKIVMKTMTHTTALLQDKRKKVMHLEVRNMLIFLQILSWSTLWISKMNCSFGTLLQEVMQNSDADAWENL